MVLPPVQAGLRHGRHWAAPGDSAQPARALVRATGAPCREAAPL